MGKLRALVDSPFLRRVSWHLKRVSEKVDRRFFLSLLTGLAIVLGVAAIVVWLAETERTITDLGASLYWSVTTVFGQGDASYVTGPVGWVTGWLLGLFGVAIVATITGALVGFVIDFLLKEGQGMGAAGYRDHIVICGWNSTARDLITELGSDDYESRLVLLCDLERSPASSDVYFVRGVPSNESDLRRAGIETARSAIICPADGSNEADMSSILTVLAIETIAPHVRTVVEVNNPDHVAHFKRADVDEVMVTSKLAAHLLARSALYPGLSELVTDLVSGGEGSELYRVELPEDVVGFSIDDVSAMLRKEHGATLLAVNRDGKTHNNLATDFKLESGDDLIVVAESLGRLSPLQDSRS
ncbi:MAG TPA: NAD-binding protein [Acidimicrobiia bacterium]|nr:NAD-binding protein [Acidimicrobiia bacterium]